MPRVLYVGGMLRSGSTLASLLLTNLERHVAVGEVWLTFRNGVASNSQCGCGSAFRDCEFWQEVGKEAFGGWHTLDNDRILKAQSRVDRTRAIPKILLGAGRRSFRHDLRLYRDALESLYRGIDRACGGATIVDESKRPSTAFILCGVPGIRLRCLRVVRDARAVAHSYMRDITLPPGSDFHAKMPKSKPSKVARRWVTVNFSIGCLRLLRVPLLTVRYEDMTLSPHQELERVAEFQGSKFDPTSLDPKSVPINSHILAGSRIRFANTLSLRIDEQWRRSIDGRTRLNVTLRTLPALLWFGYRP